MRVLMYLPFVIILSTWSALGEELPTSAGGKESADEQVEGYSEFVLRLGNESSPVDGVFGPFTYGARGAYKFSAGPGIEAGYIRLHEPQTPSYQSVWMRVKFLFARRRFSRWPLD